MNWLLDYDDAEAQLNNGGTIPLNLEADEWNQIYLDRSGGFHGFKQIGKWGEEYIKDIFDPSQQKSFLNELTTLAHDNKKDRMLVIVQLEVKKEGTAQTRKQLHAFVLKTDSADTSYTFLIDSSEKFCYQAVNHYPETPQQINFDEAFRATTACYVYVHRRCPSGKDHDGDKRNFRAKMWLASHHQNKIQDTPSSFAPSTNKGTKPHILIMKALKPTGGLQPDLVSLSRSTTFRNN